MSSDDEKKVDNNGLNQTTSVTASATDIESSPIKGDTQLDLDRKLANPLKTLCKYPTTRQPARHTLFFC